MSQDVNDLLRVPNPKEHLATRSHSAIAGFCYQLPEEWTRTRRLVREARLEWGWPLFFLALTGTHLWVTAHRQVYLFSGLHDVLISLGLFVLCFAALEDHFRVLSWWRRMRRLKYLEKLVEAERVRRVRELRAKGDLSKDDQRRLAALEGT